MTFTIEELTIPATLDGPVGDDFRAMIDVRNHVETHTFGSPDLEYTAEELHPGWLDTEYEPKRLLVARVDGRLVARAIHETRGDGSTDVAWVSVEVLPDFRRRGIGSALLERLESIARDNGRSIIQTYAIAAEYPGERLASPTGWGSVPVEDPGVRFLMRRGWSLEQVVRARRLALPADPTMLARLLADAQAAARDYRVHTWVDRTPPEWLTDIAVLSTRMSTDAPSAGLDASEEVWTVERVLDREEREAQSPRRQLIAAVEHVPTNTLVGYTELSVPPQIGRAVTQEDTIVMREHRGHRLGMLLKTANIAHLTRTHPGHPSITTFNAEENRHMLAVNDAVGFVPIAYEGAWRKVLDGGRDVRTPRSP